MKMKIATLAALCGAFLLSIGSVQAADTKKAVTLPKEAVAISPGTYTYTDAEGKKWIFRDRKSVV